MNTEHEYLSMKDFERFQQQIQNQNMQYFQKIYQNQERIMNNLACLSEQVQNLADIVSYQRTNSPTMHPDAGLSNDNKKNSQQLFTCPICAKTFTFNHNMFRFSLFL